MGLADKSPDLSRDYSFLPKDSRAQYLHLLKVASIAPGIASFKVIATTQCFVNE